MIIGISGKIGAGKDTVGKIIQYIIAQFKDSDGTEIYDINAFLIGNDVYEEYTKFGIDGEHRISNDSNWQIKKFAYKLKQCVSIITGIPIEDLEKEEVKNKVLGEEWNNTKFIPGLGITEDKTVDFVLTIRQLLQQLGTEVGRQIHPNFWINALFADYKSNGNLAFERLDSSERLPLTNDPNDFMFPKWIITDVRFPNELQAIKDKGGIVIRVNKYMETNNIIWGKDSGIFDNLAHCSETALDNATFDYTISAKQGDIESLIQQTKEILIKEKLLCLNENKN